MPEREEGTKPRTGGVGLWRGKTGGRRVWGSGAFSRGSWRSRKASRKGLGAACKIVRNQTIGEFFAARPEKMPRIFPFDINNLQGYAARLLSCAPIVEREMPPPDTRSCCLFNRAATKSRFSHCACQGSENTAKLQETCTRPICRHAKTPVTSVTCGVGGRRFYLALFPSRCSPRVSIAPVVRHSMLSLDTVRRGQLVRLITRTRREMRRKCSKIMQSARLVAAAGLSQGDVYSAAEVPIGSPASSFSTRSQRRIVSPSS